MAAARERFRAAARQVAFNAVAVVAVGERLVFYVVFPWTKWVIGMIGPRIYGGFF